MEFSASPISTWLPALLQSADPLFPTGAYAHSFGLEEFVRLGGANNEKELTFFLTAHLMPQLESVELPYLRFAIEAADSTEELSNIDREIHAWKLAAETRIASCQIGTRRLAALLTTTGDPRLIAYSTAVKDARAHGHHLCACGLQAALQNIPLEASLIMYGYQSLAGACTASLKLIRIGQEACQRALSSALTGLPGAVARSLKFSRDEAGCFSPILEIASMRHAFANERLFIS